MRTESFTTSLVSASAFAFACLLTTTSATPLSVGVISDLHINMFYDATTSANDCLTSDAPVNGEDLVAPYGRYGCDTPVELGHVMMQRYLEVYGTPDVLIIPGDVVLHDTSADVGQDPDHSAYDAVL